MYTNQIEASEMGQHTLHISPAAEHLKVSVRSSGVK